MATSMTEGRPALYTLFSTEHIQNMIERYRSQGGEGRCS